MIKNYLTTAVRFLLKNKTFSLINIVGLALGTLSCLYILLYVEEQYSYDKWEKGAGEVYRVASIITFSGARHTLAASSPVIVPKMKKDLPGVRQYTRVCRADIFGLDKHMLKYKERSFYEPGVLYVDSTFFDVFSFPFLRGEPLRALTEPYSVVLTKATADRLFGSEDPMGKAISVNSKGGVENLKVTGVLDDSRMGATHLSASAYITMHSGPVGNIINSSDNWASGNVIVGYVRLQSGVDPHVVEKQANLLVQRYGAAQLKSQGMQKEMQLQPIGKIHTLTGLWGDLGVTVSPAFLGMLMLIAVLIQIIACINFMNLSTARASKRAKEVGVRKVIGAGRLDLIRQFIGESFLLSLMGITLALPLLALLLPYLNQITHARVSVSFLGDYRVWLMLAVLVLFTGLLSGSYPAFYLSAFEAIKVIKGNFTNRVSAAGIRRSLVVFQFSLSIILITGIVIIHSQLNYVKQMDLGFDQRQRIILNIYTDGSDVQGLTEALRLLPGVTAATRSNSELGRKVMQDRNIYLDGGAPDKGLDVPSMVSDEYFVRASGIRLISGHDFGAHDSAKVIINETLARRLHLDPRTAPGTRLHSKWSDYIEEKFVIAGVAKDFNFSSLHDDIEPFVLICDPKNAWMRTIMVSCNTRDYRGLLDRIGAVWQKYVPGGAPLEYAFMDEEINKLYETDITLSDIINSFTGVAILISCLGLFGLAAFSAEQRSKEIGVRKVLGASVTGIVRLLSIDFLRLVGIALLLSIPISWWVMHEWLLGFAYRTPIQWWMFALSGAAAIGIAFFTISLHTVKAAGANPVKALRSE
jgi:putative ABC transport system permease protein